MTEPVMPNSIPATASENEEQKLLVFSDDWGRHPSSCQHLVRQLLDRVDVTWVNTIGMRPPRLDRVTIARASEKLGGWFRRSGGSAESIATDSAHSGDQTKDGPRVIDSKMWPWMSHRWDRWLNRKLLVSQLSEAARNATVITTIPIVCDLVEHLPAARWVYYCVDDFSVWPGLDGKTLGRMEDELLPKMDAVVAVSDTLVESLSARGCQAELMTHGVDLSFWQQAKDLVSQDESSAPLALFWGVIDRRMNAEWILSLADALAEFCIRLVGPMQDPDPRLLKHPKIDLPGPVDFQQLPALAAKADVLIMPYADLPVTRAMQPLKLKEYLATGKPVVTSSLPTTDKLAAVLDVATDQQQFVDLVRRRGSGEIDSTQEQARESMLSTEGWATKAEWLFRHLNGASSVSQTGITDA